MAAYRKRLQALRESAPIYEKVGPYRTQTAAVEGRAAPTRLPSHVRDLGNGRLQGREFDGTMAKAGALLGLVGR